MKKSKRTKACDMKKIKKALMERDNGCIFCRMGYNLPAEPQYIFDAMHYIRRSRGGLGIVQNGAIGCRYHHTMMDFDVGGKQKEMMELFKGYLMERYPGWNEDDLIYNKWGEIFGQQQAKRCRRRTEVCSDDAGLGF